jgi:hypothetical protein
MPVEPASKTPATPARRKPSIAQTIHRSRNELRREALTGIGQLGSLLCVVKGQYADAGAIAEHGPKLSAEIANLGDGNETIASWLDYLCQSGPYMGLLSAGLPFLLQLAVNHGKIDYTKLPPDSGIKDPVVLEKRVKAEMEYARAQILEEIRDIEKRTRSLNGEAM